jgi:hypothetical protein
MPILDQHANVPPVLMVFSPPLFNRSRRTASVVEVIVGVVVLYSSS